MKILVELTDATESTTSNLTNLLEEELAGVLGPRGFKLTDLIVVADSEQTQKKPALGMTEKLAAKEKAV